MAMITLFIKYQLKDLIQAIEKDQQPPITGQDGLKTIEIIERCLKMVKTSIVIKDSK